MNPDVSQRCFDPPTRQKFDAKWGVDARRIARIEGHWNCIDVWFRTLQTPIYVSLGSSWVTSPAKLELYGAQGGCRSLLRRVAVSHAPLSADGSGLIMSVRGHPCDAFELELLSASLVAGEQEAEFFLQCWGAEASAGLAVGDAPAGNWFTIVASDTIDLPTFPRSIWVGAAGDMTFLNRNGTSCVMKGIQAGTVVPGGGIKRIMVTGTTAGIAAAGALLGVP